MGQRNADRVRLWEIARGKESALDLYKRKWLVRWRCQTCQTTVLIDLQTWSEHSPRANLWNWHPRCRAMRGGWRCGGAVTFQLCAHERMGWVDMVSASLMPGQLIERNPIDAVTGRPEPPLPASPPAGPPPPDRPKPPADEAAEGQSPC